MRNCWDQATHPRSQRAEPHISNQAPLVWRAPEGPAAVPVGGGGARAGLETMRRAYQHTRHHWSGGRRRDLPRCRWAAAGPGRASRRRAERSSWRGRLAGGPPPTGAQSSPAQQGTPSSPAQQAAGCAKGAGTEVPAPCRLTQPLPRRGSGRMILSPGDGDASTGTCRPRRPLPGPLRRSGRRSRCARGPSSAWWPGHRARRNRSSRR